MIKNIIFDWSGVINDIVDNHVEHISHMFVINGGRPITKRELRQKWTQPYMKFYNLYFPDWSFEDQRRYYLDSIEKFRKHKIYPGMKKLLINLKKQKCNLYVISSDLPITFNTELVAYGLQEIFKKTILDSYDKVIDLRKLIKSEKLNLEETVFIGDTIHEIECAKATEIKSVAVTWGITTTPRLKAAKPTFIASTPAQLQKILLK